MMWSTYPLATRKGMATGFVIARKDRGGIVPIVVTPAHVLETIGKGPLAIGVRVIDADGEPQIAVLTLQAPRSAGAFYVRHPTQDIGAFELHVPTESAKVIALTSFVTEGAVARKNQVLRAGAEVSFVGYPAVQPGTPGGFPVLRTGKVASYSTAATRAQRKFLINADVYPGDSGAPVFVVGRGGRPELVGMIVERIGGSPRAFSHFAIAVDAGAIRETLQVLPPAEKHP